MTPLASDSADFDSVTGVLNSRAKHESSYLERGDANSVLPLIHFQVRPVQLYVPQG